MAQYYDFGDQVGSLLQNAIANVERNREFTAEQAMKSLELDRANRQFWAQLNEKKAEFAKSSAQDQQKIDNEREYQQALISIDQGKLTEQQKNDRAAIISDMSRDYTTAPANLDPAVLKGLDKFTPEQIAAPYKKAYGETTPTLPNATYYRSDMLKEAIALANIKRQMDYTESLMPKNLAGTDKIPIPKTDLQYRNEISLSPPSELAPYMAIQGRLGRATKIKPEELRAVMQKAYPKTIDWSLVPENGVRVGEDGQIKITQEKTDVNGNPLPLAGSNVFNKQDVKDFFSSGGDYEKLLQSFNSMRPQDKKQSSNELIQVGGLLGEIAGQFPEYKSKVQPFQAYWDVYNTLRMDKMNQVQAAISQRNEAQLLSKATSIATSKNVPDDDPIKQDARNTIKLLLNQENK